MRATTLFIVEEVSGRGWQWRLSYGRNEWAGMESRYFDSKERAVEAIRVLKEVRLASVPIAVRIGESSRVELME